MDGFLPLRIGVERAMFIYFSKKFDDEGLLIYCLQCEFIKMVEGFYLFALDVLEDSDLWTEI